MLSKISVIANSVSNLAFCAECAEMLDYVIAQTSGTETYFSHFILPKRRSNVIFVFIS